MTEGLRTGASAIAIKIYAQIFARAVHPQVFFFNPEVVKWFGQRDVILLFNRDPEISCHLSRPLLWQIKVTRPLRNVRLLEDQPFACWLIF